VAGEIWRLDALVRVAGAEFEAAPAERVDEDNELAGGEAKSQRRRRARNRSPGLPEVPDLTVALAPSARALPAGAVFHRCALQVNPHHYGGTFRGQAATSDVATHARAIVDKALSLGISVLAVTDHNDVSGVPAFRAPRSTSRESHSNARQAWSVRARASATRRRLIPPTSIR